MILKLIHDFSLSQLKSGWANNVDGFYFATFWYMNQGGKYAYDFVRNVTLKGGLKKAFGIPEDVIYIQGSDRPIESERITKRRVFSRNPLWALREAVCMMPDVVQVFDLPLEANDTEDVVVQKLSINRDMVIEYHNWLVENKFRSKKKFETGLPRNARFCLLGVVHGDHPSVYEEEAEFMRKYCEILGIPVAGLTLKRKYRYIEKILDSVLKVASDRIIQLMGFGMSHVEEIKGIVRVARKYDATIWLESSTIVRNSSHAHKVLTVNKGRLTYVPVGQVKNWKAPSKSKGIFEYNNKVLTHVLKEIMNWTQPAQIFSRSQDI